jgi:hypothetical protein
LDIRNGLSLNSISQKALNSLDKLSGILFTALCSKILGGAYMRKSGLTNLVVSFKGRKETLEKVFGTRPIPVTKMTKSLWNIVKKFKLLKRKK